MVKIIENVKSISPKRFKMYLNKYIIPPVRLKTLP